MPASPATGERALRVLLDVSAVPPRPVGAGVYTVALARELATHDDVELVLLARVDDGARWSAIAPDADLHAVVPPRRPARLAWEQARGGAMAARLGVRVWHGPHYTMPRALPCPSVVTIHDLTFFDLPGAHERAKVVFFRRAIRASAHNATRLICVSQATAGRLDALLADHAPVSTAHHGVDHDRFRPDVNGSAADDRELLARRGIDGRFVAFVGTVEPRKDLPTLVAAFADVARDEPDLRLVVAGGDGWGVAALREAITDHHVATRVIRTGYVPDEVVPALYRRAAAVVYPSLAEGFGLPALEAMACGAALVTTSGSAMEEVVGDAAILVPAASPDALAAGIRRALEPSTGEDLGSRGVALAAGATWKACADDHVRAYRAAVHGQAGG
jgi:glycosyltransferase involved in cell wall biosynthesis